MNNPTLLVGLQVVNPLEVAGSTFGRPRSNILFGVGEHCAKPPCWGAPFFRLRIDGRLETIIRYNKLCIPLQSFQSPYHSKVPIILFCNSLRTVLPLSSAAAPKLRFSPPTEALGRASPTFRISAKRSSKSLLSQAALTSCSTCRFMACREPKNGFVDGLGVLFTGGDGA